ncbi:hypothetical protein [Streptomyces tremellae]|uniref:Uncharacterized protein n=1 Tax=Streptomyces tremellae TaxID=1124239 RepID=A0ABP7EG60_9ACTN
MSDRPSTFGGEWRRPRQDGMGRDLRDVQDRASYDSAPAAGVSCMLPLAALAAVLGVVLG